MKITKKLQQQVQKLSPGERLELACQMFGCGVETDNYGQILLFTNLKYANRKLASKVVIDIIRKMTDKDFE